MVGPTLESLANCRSTLTHNKKCPLCHRISQLSIFPQRPNSGPIVCCSEFCSDTLEIIGISTPAIPNPPISQRFPQIANDRSTNFATSVGHTLASLLSPPDSFRKLQDAIYLGYTLLPYEILYNLIHYGKLL